MEYPEVLYYCITILYVIYFCASVVAPGSELTWDECWDDVSMTPTVAPRNPGVSGCLWKE